MDKEVLKKLQEASDEARERFLREQNPFNRLDSAGGKRDPAGHHIALAFAYPEVQSWLVKHRIEPRTVKYVQDPRDVRGAGWDLIAICFPDWGDRQLRDSRFRDAITLVQSRTIAYRYVDTMEPFVEKGRIIGWIPKSNQR